MAIHVSVIPGPCSKAGPFPQSASQTMGVPRDPNVPDPALPGVPGDILVVEDNFIIALDLETMLQDLGVASVRTANTVADALALIADAPPEFGLIDINLGDDKSFSVAERLRELGIPFVFTTGYGDNFAFPVHLAEARIMTKPYTIDALREAIFLAGPPKS